VSGTTVLCTLPESIGEAAMNHIEALEIAGALVVESERAAALITDRAGRRELDAELREALAYLESAAS
jgi:hypothetical protein